MPHFLPVHLLQLFEPREPLEYLPPAKPFKKAAPYTGIAEYAALFEDPKDAEYGDEEKVEQRKERKERIRKARAADNDARNALALSHWKPKERTEGVTGNPFKTLFVARLSYETTEAKLKRELEVYGNISTVILVCDKDGKSKGYAFVEYERERDMKTAYKQAEGMRIDGRRILVDMERGRTIPDWKPRRLGGGLGGTRVGGKDDNVNYQGRSPPRERGEVVERSPYAGGGGYRGDRGGGGGYRGGGGGGRYNGGGGGGYGRDRYGGGGGGGGYRGGRDRYGGGSRDRYDSYSGGGGGGDRYSSSSRRY